MTATDDVRELVRFTARQLAQIEPSPEAWSTWLVYLAECLEAEAAKFAPNHPAGVELLFERLQDALTDRLNAGRW